jgi:hypothetical protein
VRGPLLGCGGTIACYSRLTELITNRSIADSLAITPADIEAPKKRRCLRLRPVFLGTETSSPCLSRPGTAHWPHGRQPTNSRKTMNDSTNLLDPDFFRRMCEIAQRLPRWLKDTRGQTPQERDLDRARLVRCILRLAAAQRDFEQGIVSGRSKTPDQPLALGKPGRIDWMSSGT